MATEEITALLGDSAKMDMLVQGIERASRSLEIMTQIAMDGIKGVKSDIDTLDEKMKGTTDEAASGWKKLFDIQSAAMEEFWDKNESAAKTFHDSELARMSDKQKKAERDLAERKTWAFKLKEIEADMGGSRSGRAALETKKFTGASISSTPLDAMAKIPYLGPIMALFLRGTRVKHQIRAGVAEGLAGVDLIGGSASKTAKGLIGLATQMNIKWGSFGAEIGATATALTNVNVSAEDFSKRASVGGKRLSESILTAATKLDMYGMAAGTTGKLIASAYESAAIPVGKVAEEVLNLGLVALGTNTNMQVLFNSMMTATSGLRLQRQGVADLAEVYLDLQAGLEAGGMDKNAAKAQALRGVELMGSLSGLDQGLMGYAVQRMQRQGLAGGSGDAFEALTQFRLGELPGTEGKFAGSLAGQLQGIAREQFGGNKYRQIGGLEKQGLSLELARDIVMLGEGTDPQKLKDAFKNKQQVFNDAMKKRASRADLFEATTRLWQRHIEAAMISLVHMVAYGIKGMNPFQSPADKEANWAKSDTAGTNVLKAFNSLGGGLGDMFNLLLPPATTTTTTPEKPPGIEVVNDTGDSWWVYSLKKKRAPGSTPASRSSSPVKTSRTRSSTMPAQSTMSSTVSPTMTMPDGSVK